MLTAFLTADHRRCDALFAQAENAAGDGDGATALAAFSAFAAAITQHLAMEEELLFPAFEARSGIADGPTAVMRMEHAQIRSLLAPLRQALADAALDAFLGGAETLNILIQQHNMKEEQMLYPLCDRVLGDRAAALLERLQAH